MLGTDKNKRRKKEEKKKLIVMSCTWKIRLSPNENQESQVQKCKKKNDEKMHKHFDNFFPPAKKCSLV